MSKPSATLFCVFVLLFSNAALAPAQSLAQPEDSPAKPAEDMYKVPDKDVAALREFIMKLTAYRPRTRQDALNHQAKVVPALRTAANRIIAKVNDKASSDYQMAESLLLQIDIQSLRAEPTANAKPVVDRTLGFVKGIGAKTSGFEVELLMLLGQILEDGSPEQKKLAITVYNDGAALLKDSADERVREYASSLEGTARRLDLPGKKMEVAGTTHGGKKFDIGDLKGKVVLVDFWATWCGPCLREIPNMRANYERFHAHGFEIVGISLDENRPKLDDFLKEQALSWTILHSNEPDGGHPTATFYGIQAIPAMFLLDRKGVVVSTTASGANLTRLLEEQFPKVVEAEKEADTPPAK